MVQNADGIFARARITGNMDVPLSGGSPGVFPGSADVIGHNTRPTQLIATAPPAAVSGGEFIAVGYTAGCGGQGAANPGATGCTGIHSGGGVYKKVYVDGVFCANGCKDGVWIMNPVSAGNWHNFQIQRYGGSSPGYRVWFDGNLKWNTSGNRTLRAMHMTHSRISLGVESATAQQLNMNQDTYKNIQWHRNGAPSASPPGTTNYGALLWANLSNPHAPACRMTRQTTTIGGEQVLTALKGEGRC